MTEQGTRTPAQQWWAKRDQYDSESQPAMVMSRAEEIASDVRALAATVAEQSSQIQALLSVIDVGDMESPGRADMDRIGRSTCEHGYAYTGGTVADWCPDCRKKRDSGSAEAAPEPVCQNCGHAQHHHIAGAFECENGCRCRTFVPAEQAVQEPPALDPVRIESAARAAFESQNGSGWEETPTKAPWVNLAIAAIRAYGADAREGGK